VEKNMLLFGELD